MTLEADHAGVGATDDGHLRIDSRLQRRANLADGLEHADEVGGAATEFGWQQGVLDGQRGNPGALQFGNAHHVERVAVTVVGIGQHRQLGNAADARGLLDELAQGDEVEVRRGQHLQRGHRATENADLEAEIGGDACRHRVEHRRRVEAAVGVEQLAEVAAQVMMRESRHIGSVCCMRCTRVESPCLFISISMLRSCSAIRMAHLPFIRRRRAGGAAHRPCTARWR